MDLIITVLGIAFIGFLVWLITEKIPMDHMFRIVIYVVATIVMVLWLISRFGGAVPNVMP